MADDLLATLESLRALYAKGILKDDAYGDALSELRHVYGTEALDALLNASPQIVAPSTTTQIITGHSNVGVAIAGNQYGHIFIGGKRTASDAALLHAYLQRVITACDSLPLQAFRDKQDLHDQVALSLERVYTELATSADPVPRERLDGDDLAQLDADAFWQAHIGDRVLPWPRRVRLFRPLTEAERAARQSEPGLAGRGPLPDMLGEDVEALDAARLKALAQQVPWLQFAGPQLVTEAITANPRLVLLGEPGSGKSTALRYLALTLAHAALDDAVNLQARLPGWPTGDDTPRLLPLFLPLLPFARQLAADKAQAAGAAELWNHLAAQLGRYQGLVEAVHSELEAGRVLLMLDGLDEVAGDASRSLVVHAVAAFSREYPQCRIVVSCRVRAYEGEPNAAWQIPGWPTATLADWTPAQMQHFVAAWYDAVGGLPPDERERRRDDLQAALARRDDLLRLGVRPLLLTIMALVHYNDSKLPEERAALYSRCVDILLARWELGRTLSGYASQYGTLMDYIGMPDADVKTLRPLLQQAAFRAHRATTADSPGSLSRNDLRILVADALEGRHANPHEAARRFLEYTDTRAGLLQARNAGDEYVFPHLTFLEYLAGLQLVSGANFVAQIMTLRQEDRWRVPIFLGVGHAVNESLYAIPYQLLNRLRCASGREAALRQRDLILSAEIAEDVGWARLTRGGDEFVQLRADLAHDLVAVVEGTTLPANERVRAGELLGALGDPRPGVCDLQLQMVEIAGGSFVIGDSGAGLEQAVDEFIVQYNALPGAQLSEDDKPIVRAWLGSWGEHTPAPMQVPSFALARYPVTNAQFQEFIKADCYDPEAHWWDAPARAWLARDDAATEGLQSYQRRRHKDRPEWWDDPRFGIARPNHPVVGVNWYEATAFCAWLTQHLDDGYIYRLPSEAEWEYAARGSAQCTYAWGNAEPDGERANVNEQYDGTTAVGCFPAGATPRTGLLDMAGNVWEWTRSAYQPYPYDPTDGREDGSDPAQKHFTLRGGAWGNQPLYLRAAFRVNSTPVNHDQYVGFRLARHLKTVKPL
ncbi:SUMF1/EgtB/PvdO family nonheme iron enzyme [Oscillochloris sp. ZM17-4]|uniref:SUMF1/EgtB/PvdO family nonheme iron enzyme n=1 Tax=Oscillochloris sp. ZM17-4 TaxID=2866714 RepID=UPI001C72CA3E|nr:SUMF1/EgtB/PvdO family nonheme iron enzyme [Oscillochloris sp. ZM17-4]MBX0331481.1 SUMF1/EgtB/PvdO family nonheme iron enzyme [Oscillochloris sp. ZM17-4]